MYIDDVVVFTDTWENHLDELQRLLSRHSDGRLVVIAKKCDFVIVHVQYLGYVVARGVVCLSGGDHKLSETSNSE